MEKTEVAAKQRCCVGTITVGGHPLVLELILKYHRRLVHFRLSVAGGLVLLSPRNLVGGVDSLNVPIPAAHRTHDAIPTFRAARRHKFP